MVKIFFKLLNFNGLIIFVNNTHKVEHALGNLLKTKDIAHIFVYRSIQIYYVNKNIIILNKFIFFIFSIILGFRFQNKFIMIFSQPYFALPYIILGSSINVYFYDIHKGLLYTHKTKLMIEKISIYFFRNIIHRDLRLWVEYKKTIKKNFRKNLLIPDYAKKIKEIKFKKDNGKIKCAVIGWVDDQFVKVDDSIKILANLGVEIYFFTSKTSFELSIKNILFDKSLMKQMHHIGYLNTEDLNNFLQDFSIGLSPHDAKKPKLSKNYRNYCSSMRLINYIENSLTIFLSNKTFYQKFVCRKYNANCFDIKDLKFIKTIEQLKTLIIIKKIVYNNSIFNKKKLSKKLINFLALN